MDVVLEVSVLSVVAAAFRLLWVLVEVFVVVVVVVSHCLYLPLAYG